METVKFEVGGKYYREWKRARGINEIKFLMRFDNFSPMDEPSTPCITLTLVRKLPRIACSLAILGNLTLPSAHTSQNENTNIF